MAVIQIFSTIRCSIKVVIKRTIPSRAIFPTLPSWPFKSIDNNNRVIVQFTSLSNIKRKILYKYLLLEAKKHCILLYTHNNPLRLKFPIYIIYWNDWMEPSNSIWVRFTWDPFLKAMNKKCITLYVYQSSLWRWIKGFL